VKRESKAQRYIEKIERNIDIYSLGLKINNIFVAFVLPSSGIKLGIYHNLYGLCQLRPLDSRTNVTKMLLIISLNPPPVV